MRNPANWNEFGEGRVGADPAGRDFIRTNRRASRCGDVSFNGIDQNPIWFDVTVARADEFSTQRMIFVRLGQGLVAQEQVNDMQQFAHILASFLHPFIFFFEGGCVAQPAYYASNCATRSRMSLAVCRFFPA